MCQTARMLNCFSFLISEAQMLQLHLYKHVRVVCHSGLVLSCAVIVSGWVA
jgi:hypothetical protein